MYELRFLDSPRITEEEAIQPVAKHIPIAVQAYIQTTNERTFLTIWEKLGEIESTMQKEATADMQIGQNKFTIQRTNTYSKTNSDD